MELADLAWSCGHPKNKENTIIVNERYHYQRKSKLDADEKRVRLRERCKECQHTISKRSYQVRIGIKDIQASMPDHRKLKVTNLTEEELLRMRGLAADIVEAVNSDDTAHIWPVLREVLTAAIWMGEERIIAPLRQE